jgi:L-threonylcarbamoyladenylate synthase
MIGTDVHRAANLLKSGKLVAIPTETVYGLAANALDEEDVLAIFKAKNRPHFDPLIVHVHSYSQLEELTASFPPSAVKLAEAFWPGPLTLILPKATKVPDLVTSGLQYVGVRMPRHPLTRELLTNLDFPLAAPSANPFGYVSPTTAQHVDDQLGDKVDYILDGGPCSIGLESTIVSFGADDQPTLLRYGAITENQIIALIGKIDVKVSTGSKPDSPGQLDRHYATSTPIRLISPTEISTIDFNDSICVIGFGEDENSAFTYNLSRSGSLEEAATNLFRILRLTDSLGFEELVISTVPDKGLGKAINDRLRRAAF